MKLKQLGSNQTLLQFNDGNELFFSYETPVAGFANGYFRTGQHYSSTTTRHINNYLPGDYNVRTVPQEQIDLLLELTKLGGV